MEVDDEPTVQDQTVSGKPKSGTVTIVTPTNIVVSTVGLPTSTQRIVQTNPSSTFTGSTTPKLQVLKLVTPSDSGKTSGISGETVRLITSGSLQGAKVQISANPSSSANQPRTLTTQRLILPATSIRSTPQIVTIPVTQNTSRLQTVLSSNPTIVTQKNSGAAQQVLAFISPQKQVNQTVSTKIVAQPATLANLPSKNIIEVTNTGGAQVDTSIVKKEPIQDDTKQRKPCNCTKSHCLKLYCDCFANGEFCSNCNCVSCSNNLENEEMRQKAIKQCLIRNPQAFHPKIGKGESAEVRRHQKGCNCKRSGCLKNYCECFEAKITCGSMCKCVGCKNCDDNNTNKSLMSLADAAMVRTMQQTAASDRLAEPLHSLTTLADSNKTRESMKAHMTSSVVKSVLDCLIAQCREAEIAKCKPDTTEKVIMEEFGRCLNRIIQVSTINHKT